MDNIIKTEQIEQLSDSPGSLMVRMNYMNVKLGAVILTC